MAIPARPIGQDPQSQLLWNISKQIEYLIKVTSQIGGGGGGGTDKEFVVTVYTAKNAFTGASVGDIITCTQVIDVTTNTPVTITTIWRNQTTATDLAGPPSFANLTLEGSTALTDAQLRASEVPVIANAGTNLNTSSLALENGGNLASINTKTPALVGGKVPVDTGFTQPLTDTQLRASALPVSGTVTSNIGTTNGLALDATLTNGNQKVINRGASKGTTLAGDITSTNIDANTQAMDVSIKGNTSVNGTVTANAGTNLNTSALALESGGNLASLNTKTPALGQALAAASTPVVLTAAQITALTPLSTVGVTQATAANLNATIVGTGTLAVQNTAAVVGGNTVAVKTDGSAVTQPISATALPLPVGAATSALQTTGNDILNFISLNTANLLYAFTDLSGTIIGTTTSPSFRPSAGQAYSINVEVTAFTGTNRTLDFTIQESDDNGNIWTNIWTLPRITTTGSYRSPTIPYRGVLIRYIQTIGGTGVSCTRSINRIEMNSYMSSSPSQLFDRAINLNTLGATSAVLNTQNAKYIQFGVSQTGGTVAPVLTLQGSEDGITWYQTTNSVAGDLTLGTAQFTPGQVRNQQFARLIVTTAGVGVTNNYVFIKGF